MTSPPNRHGAVYVLDHSILARTQEYLRTLSERGAESYVVWVGELADRNGWVRDVWPLNAEAGAYHARVAFAHVLDLASRVEAKGWYILAQLHTHPSGAFHSRVDDASPLSSQVGFISIVVPDFAQREPMAGWAAFEHMGRGEWRRIAPREMKKRFKEEPSRDP